MRPLPAPVIEELCVLCAAARAATGAFSEAVKAQAVAYEVARGALRRYIAAREAGHLLDLDTEAGDLATLLEIGE